ncbi:MAG: HdeD family acid-resistance protein [Candidatus Ventricola sp.]
MKKTNKSPLTAAREIKLSFTIAAVVYLALGILLLLAPNTSRKLLCTLIGAGVSIYGLMGILSFVMDRGSGAYTLELLIGVCALAFGVFSLINPTFLMDFLFTVLGLVVIVTSVSGIKRALNLRAFGYARWWGPMALSCATLLIALSIVFMPQLYGNMLMMVIGAILIVEAVGDLLSIHRLSSFAKSITYTIEG